MSYENQEQTNVNEYAETTSLANANANAGGEGIATSAPTTNTETTEPNAAAGAEMATAPTREYVAPTPLSGEEQETAIRDFRAAMFTNSKDRQQTAMADDRTENDQKSFFYDQKGKLIGKSQDERIKGKVYIVIYSAIVKEMNSYIKKQKKQKVLEKDIFLNVSKYDFNTSIEKPVGDGFVELPPYEHRLKMSEIIKNREVKTVNGTKYPKKSYEVGGYGGYDKNGELVHIRAQDGDPKALSDDPNVSIDPRLAHPDDAKKASELQKTKDYHPKVKYTWHLHPEAEMFDSGPILDMSNNSGGSTYGKSYQKMQWLQTPSIKDRKMAKELQEQSECVTNFVIAPKEEMVFVFNAATPMFSGDGEGESQRTGYTASFPYDKFMSQLEIND